MNFRLVGPRIPINSVLKKTGSACDESLLTHEDVWNVIEWASGPAPPDTIGLTAVRPFEPASPIPREAAATPSR